jgi:hypothetical protein
VYDSNNAVVGTLFAVNNVLVNVNGHIVELQFNFNGFQENDASQVQFLHLTSDCSGPRYLDASVIPSLALSQSGVLYYPSGSPTSLTANSVETFNSGDNVSLPGSCIASFPDQSAFGSVATFSVSTLGLVPPFSLH